jgi:hypothetical protein
MNMSDCPKFEGCSAPICPLDPDWKIRTHLDGERVCFYLTEYSKEANKALLRAGLPREHYQALVRVYPEVVNQFSPIRRQLKRSSKNPPRIGRKPGRNAA